MGLDHFDGWKLSPRDHLRPCRISDIYIMLHYSSKIAVRSSNRNNFVIGGTKELVLKGHNIREVEKHCTVASYKYSKQETLVKYICLECYKLHI